MVLHINTFHKVLGGYKGIPLSVSLSIFLVIAPPLKSMNQYWKGYTVAVYNLSITEDIMNVQTISRKII